MHFEALTCSYLETGCSQIHEISVEAVNSDFYNSDTYSSQRIKFKCIK